MQARRDPYRGGAGDQYRGHGCPRKHGAAQAPARSKRPNSRSALLANLQPVLDRDVAGDEQAVGS